MDKLNRDLGFTKIRSLVWIVTFTLTFAFPFSALAQSQTAREEGWQELSKLERGKRILVETKGRRVIYATFVGVSDDTLLLFDNGQYANLERANIQRVYRLKTGWSRKTTTIIGAAAGMFVGIAIGAKIDNSSAKPAESVAGVTAIYGIAGGYGIGYLLGGKQQKKLLYEAK